MWLWSDCKSAKKKQDTFSFERAHEPSMRVTYFIREIHIIMH